MTLSIGNGAKAAADAKRGMQGMIETSQACRASLLYIARRVLAAPGFLHDLAKLGEQF